MRRVATIALVVCVAGAVLVGGLGSGGTSADSRTYRIVFDNAFGLVEGGDFRVGGVRAGQTTRFDITPSRTGPPKATVVAEVGVRGIPALRRDATCTIEPQSLVGEYFVDCQPGSSPAPLGNGGTIPVSQTKGTIPADLVNDILRRPPRERLRLLVVSLGTGLAGRPEDFAEVLERAHPGLRETSEALRILGAQNREIRSFLADADTVVGAVEERKRDVRRFVDETGTTAAVGASRRRELREAVRRLPGFLTELRPSMRELAELAEEGTPLASDLERAAPDATLVLRRTQPFAANALPALRALGRASVPAEEALRAGREEVDTLRDLSRDAPPLAKPLRQLLETLDDRRRAVEDDPRAVATSPPVGDPTFIGERGGFTGFEALANYFFWQSLTTNGFDSVGHLLRVGATETKCSPYRNAPPRTAEDEQLFRDCNSWLGPNQPGINAPDPSVPAGTAGRGAIEPEAAPLPGRRDISQPRIVLPPGSKRLLNAPPPEAEAEPIAPTAAPGDPTPLLDFLLAP